MTQLNNKLVELVKCHSASVILVELLRVKRKMRIFTCRKASFGVSIKE